MIHIEQTSKNRVLDGAIASGQTGISVPSTLHFVSWVQHKHALNTVFHTENFDLKTYDNIFWLYLEMCPRLCTEQLSHTKWDTLQSE